MSNVQIQTNGILVPLKSGQVYFNQYWLRDNCPSSFDPQTRERIFDICTLTKPPMAKKSFLEDDQLVIHWTHEPLISRFKLVWLETWANNNQRADPANLIRKCWYANHYEQFSSTELETSQTKLTSMVRALLEDGIAIVTDMEDSDQALTNLANLLGEVQPSVPGYYFDVHVHIDPVNLSYTASALELHTDTPAEELPPGIQFLHCRANTVAGGNSLFLDGAAVAEDFRQQHPEAFEILATTRIPYYYEHDNFDWRSRQSVIELDEQHAVTGLTISRHMADVMDLPQRQLDDYYPAYQKFGQRLLDPMYHNSFRMNAGECFVFDNHRVVHGRGAYEANSGDRYLRGCYIDRGELRSRFRTLVKNGFDRAAST